MSGVEISLSEEVEAEIEHLVDEGEFMSRDQAIEELLAIGMNTYSIDEEEQERLTESVFRDSITDQQDPASHGSDSNSF